MEYFQNTIQTRRSFVNLLSNNVEGQDKICLIDFETPCIYFSLKSEWYPQYAKSRNHLDRQIRESLRLKSKTKSNGGNQEICN
jgi:hypothetical protein